MQLDLSTETFKPLEHLKQSEILYFFYYFLKKWKRIKFSLLNLNQKYIKYCFAHIMQPVIVHGEHTLV